MMHNGMDGMCRCPHHKVKPVLVILFGVLFLLGSYGVVSEHTVEIGWPILVILAGLMKLFSGWCKCCDGSCEGGTCC